MADQTTLMGLLKTPSQIRKESQERLMEESLARSQMMLRGSTGGTTALPGIISSYGAQAAQRGTQAGAGLLRGVAGGIGQAVGGDMGQRISDLGVPMEERQARAQQQALQGITITPEGLRKAITRLREAGASPQVIARLQEKLVELEDRTVEAPKTREVKRGDEIVTEQFDEEEGTWSEIGRAPRFKPEAEREEGIKVEVGSDKQVLDVITGTKTFADTIKSMASRPKDFFGADTLRSLGIDVGTSTDNAMVNAITAEVVRRSQEIQRNSDSPMSINAAVAQALEEQFSGGVSGVSSGEFVKKDGKWVRKN